MPTITIRVTDTERADLESAARRSGHTLSEYVRATLDLRHNEDVIAGLNVRVEEMWTRLQRLEELAGV